MKKWKIILWLLLFFPVGLYFMFTYSDWKKPLMYGITSFFILVMFLGGVELWSYLFIIGSFFAIIVGLFTVFRKKSRRNGLTTLALGVLVFAGSYPIVNEQIVEAERQEQLAIEAEAEAKRLAEEERLEEIAQKEEQERVKKENERLEAEKLLKEEIIAAIENVEEYPTQANYNTALKLLEELETKDSRLTTRLAEVLPDVEVYEELVATAEEAVEEAQREKNRTTYNEAYELVSALPVTSRTLTRRLETLDEEITEIEEEERIAAEKEAEEKQKAAEAAQKQAEEEQRIAAEQEAQRQAAAAPSQQSGGNTSGGNSSSGESSNNSSNPSGSTSQTPAPAVLPPAQTDNVEKVVYVAPQSGTKYHYSANCRGLNNANSIQEMTLSQAKSQGYDLCGWEK